MKKQEITVKDLCTKLGKHNTVVYAWLRNKHWPSSRIELVSEALRINLYALACPPEQVPEVRLLREENTRLKGENKNLQELVEALKR